MTIPVTAKSPVDAIKLIDFFYRTDIAASLAEYINYVCPVPAAQAARGDHDAVDPAVDEQLEIARLALRVVIGVAEQDRVAQLAGRVLDRTDELREERVLDVGDDEPDRPGRALAQRPGHARRPLRCCVAPSRRSRRCSRPTRSPRSSKKRAQVRLS